MSDTVAPISESELNEIKRTVAICPDSARSQELSPILSLIEHQREEIGKVTRERDAAETDSILRYLAVEDAARAEDAKRILRWSRVVNRGVAMLDYLANDKTAFEGTGTPQAVLEQMRAIECEMTTALSHPLENAAPGLTHPQGEDS